MGFDARMTRSGLGPASVGLLLLSVACGDGVEAPAGNTQIRFEAPISHRRDEMAWDYQCPDPTCDPTEFICGDLRVPTVGYVNPTPVPAGMLVEGFFDFPESLECTVYVRIQTAELVCIGTGVRPAGIEGNFTIVPNFDCQST